MQNDMGSRARSTAREEAPLPIFFHNQSGDDVVRALQALNKREPSVVLGPIVVAEIQTVTGIAGPNEPTVLLLRREHRRKPRGLARWRRRSARAALAFASIVLRGLVVFLLAVALGSALVAG